MDDARKQKIKAYLGEIRELSKKYQLKLVLKLQYSEDGIVPVYRVEDILPDPEPTKEAVPAQPAPPEPAQEEKLDAEPTPEQPPLDNPEPQPST